jgi:hypothetical protein
MNFFIFAAFSASLAQLVEQLIRNEQVVGSSPIGGSKKRTDKLPVFFIIDLLIPERETGVEPATLSLGS